MIYTSYFGKVKELQRKGIVPISISRSVPKFFSGQRILSLAPTWQMLKMSDADYDREYEKILASNDRDEIVRSFRGKDVALLCWEKDLNECHRKRVGEWLREGGYEVEEFGVKAKEPEKPVKVAEEPQQPTYEQLSFSF